MIRDLLLPTTDAGAGAQLIIALAVIALLLVAMRHRPDWRLVVAGGGLLVIAVMALRAAH